MATKKTASKGRKKVAKVMHEFKHGELKSGGRRPVKNPKQAVAIALSEAREAGAKIPKKGASKKKAAKKTAAKKSSSTKRTGTTTKKKSAARKKKS